MLICLLNDGETFTDVSGCQVIEVPDGLDIEEVEQAIDDNKFTLVMDIAEEVNKPRGYGTVTWGPEDIMSRTNLTREQAEEWLENNSKYIRDHLIEIGNESCIPTLLEEDGIEVKDDN